MHPIRAVNPMIWLLVHGDSGRLHAMRLNMFNSLPLLALHLTSVIGRIAGRRLIFELFVLE
jgi:hypothetical protein